MTLVLSVLAPAAAAPSEGPVAFEIEQAVFAPGAISRVTLAAPYGEEVRAGRLVLQFSPPVFLDTPSVTFPDAPAGLAFSLKPLGPGRYAVEFDVAPGGLQPGRRVEVSGIVRPSLAVGGRVTLRLEGTAVTLDGRELEVDPRAGTFHVREDPYPTLTLHVMDQDGLEPGSRVMVELRTYNPRVLSDGQICLRFDETAFTAIESVGVQGEPDVTYVARRDGEGTFVVTFSSPGASINRFEGALVRIGMRLAADLPHGFETVIHLDTAMSFLRDHAGEAVDLLGDDGRFRIGPSDY